jgi:hypothetical protein
MISAIPHLLHPSEPVGVFSLLAQVRLAGGNCVLDLEDTRFSKREREMKEKHDWMVFTGGALKGALERKLCRRVSGILACLGCTFVLVTFSLAKGAHSASSAQASQSHAQDPSAPLPTAHSDVDLPGKSPDELAAYVFEHHHCNTCHTLGQGGKLGFTDRGKEVGRNFEGCISLLTSMNVIAQVKPADRTTEEKTKAARFQQFGCTTCHQITPGKLGLTEYGTKLKSLHMACTDVERILAK